VGKVSAQEADTLINDPAAIGNILRARFILLLPSAQKRPTGISTNSPFKQSHDLCPRQRIEMQIEPKIRRENEITRQVIAVLEAVAGDRESHVSSPSS
jgi:hypothetical protein